MAEEQTNNTVPGYRAARSLACEKPENAERALAAFLETEAFDRRSDNESEANFSSVYEHGQLWIIAQNGAQWSVNDAVGSPEHGVVDGFCFEQISYGENERYHVTRTGAIAGEDDALLYESDSLKGFSPEIRNRLAEIHTNDPEIDWEGAEEMMINEGLMYVRRKNNEATDYPNTHNHQDAVQERRWRQIQDHAGRRRGDNL